MWCSDIHVGKAFVSILKQESEQGEYNVSTGCLYEHCIPLFQSLAEGQSKMTMGTLCRSTSRGCTRCVAVVTLRPATLRSQPGVNGYPAKQRMSNWNTKTDRNTTRVGQMGHLKLSVTVSDVGSVKEHHQLNPRGQ